MEYLKRMQKLNDFILEYLDNKDSKNLDDLAEIISFPDNQLKIYELKSILFLISKISENHHRNTFFYEKIQKIINLLKQEIKQTFSNSEIFDLFKANKRFLLILIDEDILTIDSTIRAKMGEIAIFFLPRNHQNR